MNRSHAKKRLRDIPEAESVKRVFRFEMAYDIHRLDPFQEIGIPCWLSPMLLDDPFEPEMPFAEND